jgi:squalene-hopene/tetraprenyl-beta-curcumene cyclase
MKTSAFLFMLACWTALAATPPEPQPWQANAARYLDDRIDIWFVKSKKLRTGGVQTSCVSCHTVVPYALARPALRQAAGVKAPAPQEERLLRETLLRVATYDSHEPLYKSKEDESRGSEAVLNLLILVGELTPGNQASLGEPLRKAFTELWAAQRADGAWDWLDFGNEPYESADSVYYGAALAAIVTGSADGYHSINESDSIGIAKLKSYLRDNYMSQNLYNKTWLLLASARLVDLLSQEQVSALAAELRRQQNADGGWSLYKLGPWTWSEKSAPYSPPGKPDLALLGQSDAYATGLVTYAMHEAGVAGGATTLQQARAWLQSNHRPWDIDQYRWDCWRTFSLNHDREHGGDEGDSWPRMFMSDAATAFAALALLPSSEGRAPASP